MGDFRVARLIGFMEPPFRTLEARYEPSFAIGGQDFMRALREPF